MAKVTIKTDLCKGCGLCVEACPKKIIEFDKDAVNIKGYRPVRITNQDACIACAFCAAMCPDCVLKVEK